MKGYFYVKISGKNCRVHRLVAETFLQEQKRQLIRHHGSSVSSKLQVDHIDGSTRNNHVSNLQWMTPKEHVIKTHRTIARPRNVHGGARRVTATHDQTGQQRIFRSLALTAKHFSVSSDTVSSRLRTGRPLDGWCLSYVTEDTASMPGEEFRGITFLHDRCKRGRLPMVSNMGRIEHTNGHQTCGYLHSGGYCPVKLSGQNFLVHRLVAEVFLYEQKRRLIEEGNDESELEVDHIDSNPSNNRLEKLRWVTRKMHARLTCERTRQKRAAAG